MHICHTSSGPKPHQQQKLWKTKLDMSHGQETDLTSSTYEVFGCISYAHVPRDERKKLDSKSRKCILLGCGAEIKGYRLYDVERGKVLHSRDVVFDESSRLTISGERLVRTK